MTTIGAQLALAMSLALEAAESDIEHTVEFLREPRNREERLKLAEHLLARAMLRVQTVRLGLAEAGEEVLP
jgi:hypothetical protein